MIDPTKMMQGQTSMIFNNLYVVMLYNVIDHVFSGFVAAKLPLSLTGGFKRMLHFGIDLENMEVTYVSSSSWYLLIFSGTLSLLVLRLVLMKVRLAASDHGHPRCGGGALHGPLHRHTSGPDSDRRRLVSYIYCFLVYFPDLVTFCGAHLS